MCIHRDMGELLFLDSDLVVINKAAGEPVGGDRGGTGKRGGRNGKPAPAPLLDHWRRTLEEPELQLIHRIDQPVGGIVLLGRRKETLPFFYDAFAHQRAARFYVAIVTSPPDREEGELADILTVDTANPTTTVVATGGRGTAGGKEAVLHYRIVGRTTHHTVLLVRLKTGRHHQIRAQLAHRGWNILGDARYGARRPMRDRSIGLYAWRLTTPHPTLSLPLTFTAPLPLTSLWNDVDRLLRDGALRDNSFFQSVQE